MGPLFQPSQEGPRKLKGGPEAPQKGFHKGFHSILENRGGGWRPGVTGGGNADSDSTKNNNKKGTAWGGGRCPQPMGGRSPQPEQPGHVLGVRKKQTHNLNVHSNQNRSPRCFVAQRWRASSS